jgi:DNA mismatch repair protein MutS
LHSCDLLREKIKNTLNQEAPVAISKGNAIAKGVNAELDELKKLFLLQVKNFWKELKEFENRRTGISSLKISFNNVFGYYIEVRNTHKDKVPSEWISKQTLVNAERYITEELKEYETKILGAEEKIQQIEINFLSNWSIGLPHI